MQTNHRLLQVSLEERRQTLYALAQQRRDLRALRHPVATARIRRIVADITLALGYALVNAGAHLAEPGTSEA